MNRTHLKGALLVAAVTLFGTSAYADTTKTPDKAGDKVEKTADKAADKVEKAGDKAAKAADKAADKVEKAGDKAKAAEDRSARRTAEHDAQRAKLKGILKAPLTDAQKLELRRHAERVARLERIKSVAETEKDKTTAEKTATLLTKENERHEKWMSQHAAEANAAPAAVPAAAPAADTKGGAK